MDPFITPIVLVLGKYALDKGAELGKEVGPRALDKVKEMFALALGRLRRDPKGEVVVGEFEKDPETCQKPVEKALAEAAGADPAFAVQLKGLLAKYEAAAKEHAAAMGTSYQATLAGSGGVAQGPGAVTAARQRAAGNVLAQLPSPAPRSGAGGDPRFRADTWHLPDEPLLGFVKIPAGPFVMGTREEDIPALLEQFGGEREQYEWESPQREVALPAYYIARFPVTEVQYWAFVQATGHESCPTLIDGERPYDWRDGQPPAHLRHHPVVLVTWHDAVAYCGWLTKQLRAWKGTPGPLATLLREAGWVVRLPSEAEWEKAARGVDGRLFPWGNEVDPNRANYADAGIGTTSAVGCFPGGAGPFGVEDMSGNVWEWCATKWQDTYKDYWDDNDAAGNYPRAMRGGAFPGSARYVRCACRGMCDPFHAAGYGGFRIALAPCVAPS